MSPSRVLLVSDVSGYMRGGVPAETRCLLRGLAGRGVEVALASDAPLDKEFPHFPFDLPFTDRSAAMLASHLRKFDPDLVHVLSMSAPGQMHIVPMLRGRRWVLTVHSVPPHERKLSLAHGSERLHYGLRALRFMPNSVLWRRNLSSLPIRRVIVHSRAVGDTVVAYGTPLSEVCVIPLPASAETGACNTRWRDIPAVETGRPITAVTVGGFAHTKGQHDLLKAWPSILSRHPGSLYVAIGEVRDPTYLSFLKRLAQQLRISSGVHWAVDCSDAEKQDWLRRADVYVQPSHEEGFCLAYLEASGVVGRLCGADTGAIRTISEGQPGMRCVPTRRPSALANAILELLATPMLREALEIRSANLASRFSESAYIDAHLNLYAHLGVN